MKLKELEKRLKQEPSNLGLKVQVAGLMRESGRSVEAVELYRSVALAYRDQGRNQQAIAVCKSILEIAPDDAACRGLLGMLQGRGQQSRPPATSPAPAPDPQKQVHSAVMMRPSPVPPERVPSVPSLRPPTGPPPVNQPDPGRRSSFDETPLPKPVPYHVVDPTSQPNRVSSGELDLPTRQRDSDEMRRGTTGLAQAARRISGLISDSRGIPHAMDLAAELETRQQRRLDPDELRKIEQPPPTVPIERVDDEDDDITRPPGNDEPSTDRLDMLTPPPRGSNSEDMLTPPRRGSDDAITPPPLTGSMPHRKAPRNEPAPRLSPAPRPSRPPPVVSIPPKNAATPPRPPNPALPRMPQSSAPPRVPQSSTPPRVPPPPPNVTAQGTPVVRPRPTGPPAPPPRPAMAKIPRDSDNELTKPRADFSLPDYDEDDD